MPDRLYVMMLERILKWFTIMAAAHGGGGQARVRVSLFLVPKATHGAGMQRRPCGHELLHFGRLPRHTASSRRQGGMHAPLQGHQARHAPDSEGVGLNREQLTMRMSTAWGLVPVALSTSSTHPNST